MLKECIKLVMLVGKMKKALIPLLAAILLSACGSASRRDNYVPRISLEPTPGSPMTKPLPKMPEGWPQKLRAMFRETIESDRETGAYVTELLHVPVTQFFEIVRPITCNEWTIITLLKPEVLKNYRDIYLSGDMVEHIPYYVCEKEYRKRYANNHPDLTGADGVIFDGLTTVYKPGPVFTTSVYANVQGYAIKFKTPTREDLDNRLRTLPNDRINLHQYDTALFQVQKNKDRSFLPLLREILGKSNKNQNASSEEKAMQRALMRTLSIIDPTGTEASDVYRQIFTNVESSLSPGIAVAEDGIGDIAIQAANALACARREDLTVEIYNTARRASSVAHKLGAARIFDYWGRKDLIQGIRSQIESDPVISNILSRIEKGSPGLRFKCPAAHVGGEYAKAVASSH